MARTDLKLLAGQVSLRARVLARIAALGVAENEVDWNWAEAKWVSSGAEQPLRSGPEPGELWYGAPDADSAGLAATPLAGTDLFRCSRWWNSPRGL
jgi:hypothetical protein